MRAPQADVRASTSSMTTRPQNRSVRAGTRVPCVVVTDALRLLRSWEPAPVPWAVLVVTGTLYVVAARRVTRRAPDHPWAAYRTWCFVGRPRGHGVRRGRSTGRLGRHLLLRPHDPAHPAHDAGRAAARPRRPCAAGDAGQHATTIRRRWLVPCLRSRAVRTSDPPRLRLDVLRRRHGRDPPARVSTTAFLDHPVLHDFVEHPLYLVSGLVFFQPLLVADHRAPGTCRTGSGWCRCSP